MSLSGLIMECIITLIRDYFSAVLVFFTVLFSVKLFNTKFKGPPLPPGPWGVPLFGFLPFLFNGKPFYGILGDLAEKYGPVFRLNMGSMPIVIISDPDLIRKTLRRGEFIGRPTNFISDIINGYGLINATGGRWKTERINVHARLRALGMTTVGPVRERMEAKIMIETESLLRNLATTNGKPVQADQLFMNCAANVVCQLLISERFGLEDQMLNRLVELGHDGFELYCKAEISTYIRFASVLPYVRHAVSKLDQNRVESLSIMRTYVESRKKRFDPSLNEDMIDSFLYEEYMATDSDKEQMKDIDMRLLQVLLDLFSAGSETVSTAMSWIFLYLLHHPKVVQKLQDELNTAIGRNRLPSLSDRSSLPYTEATISEVLRVANLLPLGTPHAATRDTMVGDYFIPESTTIFCNLYSCHMDPELWKSPESFEPERFINSEGKFEASKNFMPFSVGRRTCLGEVLATSELFLFVSSILHVFDLDTAHRELPPLKSILTSVNSPVPYKIRFVPRDVALLDTLEKHESRHI